MKTKIDLDALAEMTFAEYQKKFKKEIKRAQAFGKMNCVVLGEFEFACGHIGTIMVLGTYSGKLTKFYKQMKRLKNIIWKLYQSEKPIMGKCL